MRVLVTGATGFIGARLCQALRERGERVKALSRAPREAERTVQGLEQCHAWDPAAWRPPEEAFYGIDAIVHLAGEPIIGRWTADKRKEIRRSRVLGTRP
jgi:NAD dependent epimerase/dehydratase family enzyme